MTTYNHVCPCGNKYKDQDPDVYLCSTCVQERKALAKEVDARMASRPKKNYVTDLHIALTKGKTIPSGNGGHATFVRASDLGITFN